MLHSSPDYSFVASSVSCVCVCLCFCFTIRICNYSSTLFMNSHKQSMITQHVKCEKDVALNQSIISYGRYTSLRREAALLYGSKIKRSHANGGTTKLSHAPDMRYTYVCTYSIEYLLNADDIFRGDAGVSRRNTVFNSIQLLFLYILFQSEKKKEKKKKENLRGWMLSIEKFKWTIVVTTHNANSIVLCNLPYGLRIKSVYNILKCRISVFDAHRGVQ